MSTLSSNWNRVSPVLEVEAKTHHALFSAIRVGFTQKATEEQEKIRDQFLTESTTAIPANSSYPSFTFTQKEISSYLQKYLAHSGLLEEGPFFVGGVATHLMVEPEYALEFSDYDICFQLKVPAYEAIQNAFIDFFREKIAHLLKDSHYLNSKQGSEMSALLQNPKCDYLIVQAYLYKKNMLTNHQDLLGGSFFRLGLFEFKFFYKMVCRQNVFKSDGFRFPLFGDQIFCVDVDSLCTKEEFELALVAARKRHCLISKPEDTKDYLFKVVQKATQGFEFFQKDAIGPALIQFNQTFFLEKKEPLGTKLHNHQLNHYGDNVVGALFDFMNFLIFLAQNCDEQSHISQIAIFANAWLKGTLLKERNTLVGRFALLAAKFPEKALHLIHWIQGFLLHQLVKKNPQVSGYRFGYDPLTIHHALAIKIRVGECDRTSYLRTQNLPAALAAQFLESWGALEEKTPEIQPFLKAFFNECGIEELEFSKTSKALIICDLLHSLESARLTADPTGTLPFSENYLPFYTSLLNASDCVLDRSLLEIKFLEKVLLKHFDEALKFKEEAIISLISHVLRSLKQVEIADIFKISHLLKAIAGQEIVFSLQLKEALASGLLKILAALASSSDLRNRLAYCNLVLASNSLGMFNEVQQQGLFPSILAACTALIHSENLHDFPIVLQNLLAIYQKPDKSEELKKELFGALKTLSDQLYAILERLTGDFSNISLRDFKALCNGLLVWAHLHSLNVISHLEEGQEIMQRVFMHALQSKDPSFIYSAGLTSLKMFKLRMIVQKHLITVLYLAEKLLVSSREENDEEASEIALKMCSELGKKMCEALQTHEQSLEWQHTIQIQFVKRMAESLFSKKLSDFNNSIESREKNFNVFFKAFSVLPNLSESQKTHLKKMQALNFQEEHFQIRTLFFTFVAELDSEFALKVFKRCPAELLPADGLIESSKIFIENQSESSLNSAYEMWLLNIRSAQAVKDSVIHCLKSTCNLLSAHLKADGRIAIQRIHHLVEFFCLLLKEISFRRKEWEEFVSVDRELIQKELITLFKRLLERSDLALLARAETLIMRVEKSQIIPLNETGELLYQLLNRHRTIESFPNQVLINFYLEQFLPKWEEEGRKTKNERILSNCTHLLIGLCIEKSHERYDSFALELFQKALKGDFLVFDQECERFFFAIIHHFPREWKNSPKRSEKIEEFIHIVREKGILNALSFQVKLAFFDVLLAFEKESPFYFIWEEIQTMSPSTEDLSLEIVKFCRRFCQKIARSKERDLMQLGCQVLNFFKKPDSQMFLRFVEGLSSVSDFALFDFAMKYAESAEATLFSTTQDSSFVKSMMDCAMNIATVYTKANELKASLPYREFIEGLYQKIPKIMSPQDPNVDLLNVKVITFLIQLDSLEDLWRAFDILNRTQSVRVVPLFKMILGAIFKRWQRTNLIEQEVLIPIKNRATHFFAFHSSFLSCADIEECVDSLRPFFEEMSAVLPIGSVFLLGFESVENLKNKPYPGKNSSAPYSPKVERALLFYYLKMAKLYKIHYQFTAFDLMSESAKKMLSGRNQQVILEFIKESLQSSYKQIFSGALVLKTQHHSEMFSLSLPMLEDFMITYAKFDPEKTYLVIKQGVNILIPHKKKIMELGRLLNLCFALKLFEQKTLAWGQVGAFSRKALKLGQIELLDLGVKVIPLLCASRKEGTFEIAVKLLQNCTEIADLTNLDHIRTLHSCYKNLHSRALFHALTDQESSSYVKFLSCFFNFLNNLAEQKEHPQRERIAVETLVQVQLYSFNLVSYHHLLSASLKLEGLSDLSMQMISSEISVNKRIWKVQQNPDLINKSLNFKHAKFVEAQIVSCLNAFITCDAAELKRALEAKSLKIMEEIFNLLMTLVVRSQFLSVNMTSLRKEILEMFVRLQVIGFHLVPKDVAETIHDCMKLILDTLLEKYPLSSEKKV